jgi:hypothetical protein
MNKNEFINLMSSLTVIAFGCLLVWVSVKNFVDVSFLTILGVAIGFRLVLPTKN